MTPDLQVIDLIATNEGKGFVPAGRMAAAIIDIVKIHGDCLPQDLNIKGFSLGEVAEHWHMANALAKIELKFMEKK